MTPILTELISVIIYFCKQDKYNPACNSIKLSWWAKLLQAPLFSSLFLLFSSQDRVVGHRLLEFAKKTISFVFGDCFFFLFCIVFGFGFGFNPIS